MSYSCSLCKKNYKSYQSIWNHNNRYHKNENCKIELIDNKIRNYKCTFCDRKFTTNYSAQYHMSNICKNKNDKTKKLEKEIFLLKEQINNPKIIESKHNLMLKKELIEMKKKIDTIEINKTYPINNQLVDIIIEKSKKIEELQDTSNKIRINRNDTIESKSFIINDIIIAVRTEDNYINAIQLCKACGKIFNDWYFCETTNDTINELSNQIEINRSELIDNSQEDIWIHPDLAIQLSQWISPKIALQVSKWIRTLFSNNEIKIDNKILEEHDKELKIKDIKIQLLQDLYIKKQQRKEYPERNVIYMLTTEDNKKKRIYIIGKAKELKNRLSTYNKTAEHEVVYYKECKSEENMNIIEMMILSKLEIYKEKANRDRFILPINKNISHFINIIDNAINFFKQDSIEL